MQKIIGVQLNCYLFLFMKNQISEKQHIKYSARQEYRKTNPNSHHPFKKQSQQSSNHMLQTKSIIIDSHRSSKPKDLLKIHMPSYQPSANHSRKNSIHLNGFMTGRDIIDEQKEKKKKSSTIKRSKDHNRSNSTISKKSGIQLKKMLKIDLSKLKQKDQYKDINKHKILQKKQKQMKKQSLKQVNKQCFQCLYAIGKGGFGKVWNVKFKKTNKQYAMKEMHKAKIICKKSIHSVMNQKELLSKLKHPFIANMSYAFQDRQNLYLIMDLLTGGDLRYHMGCRRRFKQSEAKFFIACILMGLQFLHLNNIIHRDIKPQNIVFDQKGYLKITDLGIARAVKLNNNSDTSGTPGYMAPQVMCRQDHSFPVDYYAVGIIAYQFMLGKRPYYGRDRKQIRDQILSRQVQIRSDQIAPGWSLQAGDFINRMIQRKPSNRLGSTNGVNEIKQHPWFNEFPWAQLLKKIICAPFIPTNVIESKDYKDQISQSSVEQNNQQNKLLLRDEGVEELFQGYYYNNNKQSKQSNSKTKKETNAKTTANTHYSFVEEKQILKGKLKINNYFKK